MTLWSDIAEWRGPVLHHSGTISSYMYVVIHTADGSYEGTIAWQKNPDADNSSHFIVDVDGKIAQVNDTANRSGAQILGNPYSIAVENAGNENTPLTPYQIEANARILAKAHLVHGIPLQITNRVGTPGLGHHSMGAESGVRWGHSQCPGEIIKGQKAAILARAVEIVSGVPQQGDDMLLREPNGTVHIEFGGRSASFSSETELAGVKPAQPLVNVPQSIVDKLFAPTPPAQPVDAAAVASALAANGAFVTAVANAVGAAVKDQFGPAFDDRVRAAARAAVNARLDDDATT